MAQNRFGARIGPKSYAHSVEHSFRLDKTYVERKSMRSNYTTGLDSTRLFWPATLLPFGNRLWVKLPAYSMLYLKQNNYNRLQWYATFCRIVNGGDSRRRCGRLSSTWKIEGMTWYSREPPRNVFRKRQQPIAIHQCSVVGDYTNVEKDRFYTSWISNVRPK